MLPMLSCYCQDCGEHIYDTSMDYDDYDQHTCSGVQVIYRQDDWRRALLHASRAAYHADAIADVPPSFILGMLGIHEDDWLSD